MSRRRTKRQEAAPRFPTKAEMVRAFSEHTDIHFDIIGMDCCIMASLESCYALSPYCKYALLSEDFESGLGWSYTRWMKQLEKNPGISTPLLGKYIVDGIIKDNEDSFFGDSSCITLFNESTIMTQSFGICMTGICCTCMMMSRI
ncbi:MAG: hypothetical protein IJ679_12080 [Lachnospiraceae bacterium]|nr:hypothetical protein [Lachnospiraceae bacterium]